MDRKWTVMVYMAGDNNLDSYGVSDLKEMKAVGSTPQVAIIAQFDRSGHKIHTKRYELKEHNISSLDADVVGDLGETNTGDPDVLTDFVRWGIQKYQAERYLLIIWGHGSGAYDEDIYYAGRRPPRYDIKRHGIFRPLIKGIQPEMLSDFERALFFDVEATPPVGVINPLIAPDDDSKSFLDNVKLKSALKNIGHEIHILGMDACLMSMAEVCYQVRESVGMTVASQTEEELEGWPYRRFLGELVKNPAMTPPQLAQTIVEQYGLFYSDYKNSQVTLSAFSLQNFKQLVEEVDGLAGSLLDHLEEDDVDKAIMLARYRVQSDEIIETVDLCDLCDLLEQNCKPEPIKSACRRVRKIVKQPDLLVSNYAGTAAKYAFGLGIYFPKRRVAPSYTKLDFVSSAPRWLEFVKAYVDITKR